MFCHLLSPLHPQLVLFPREGQALQRLPGILGFSRALRPGGELLQDLSRLPRADTFQHLNSAERSQSRCRWDSPQGSQKSFHPLLHLRRRLAFQRLTQGRFDSISQFGQLLGRRRTPGEPVAVEVGN